MRAAWLCVGLAACAPGSPSMFIEGALAPDAQCGYLVSNPFLPGGTLDTSATTITYTLVPELGNQVLDISSEGSTDPPLADPSTILLRAADVELQDVTGAPLALGALPNPYQVPATGSVRSSDGASIGKGLGALEVIPPNYGAQLAGLDNVTVVAVIQAVGRTLGDAEVTAPAFYYPIKLCNGCLLLGCITDSTGMPVCRPACLPGQDTQHATCPTCLPP